MNTSPFSALSEAIKKVDAALSAAIRTICDDLCDRINEINDARRKEIERLEAEALAMENEEAAADAIPFDVMMEKLKYEDYVEPEFLQESSMFWSMDAQIFSEKMACRQREAARAMENESARQVMKRRKMLHAEGRFPDGILLEGKVS